VKEDDETDHLLLCDLISSHLICASWLCPAKLGSGGRGGVVVCRPVHNGLLISTLLSHDDRYSCARGKLIRYACYG
jgi:hypothetical protein